MQSSHLRALGGAAPLKRLLRPNPPLDHPLHARYATVMRGEFTAIIEAAPEGGFWAICPEIPGANGQGETVDEAKQSLRDGIRLVLEDRLEDVKRGLPEEAIQTVVAI